MYLYSCTCVCQYICKTVYMYILYLYRHTRVYTYIHKYMYIFIFVFIYMCVCVYSFVYLKMFPHAEGINVSINISMYKTNRHGCVSQTRLLLGTNYLLHVIACGRGLNLLGSIKVSQTRWKNGIEFSFVKDLNRVGNKLQPPTCRPSLPQSRRR